MAIIGSPRRYIQKFGVVNELGRYSATLGKHFFVIATQGGTSRVKEYLDADASEYAYKVTYSDFRGECSYEEMHRLKKAADTHEADVIIGVGGGKALDTAKGVADFLSLPLVIFPTSAATDAPCLALSVVYTPKGQVCDYMTHPFNPDYVIADTQIISEAPLRLLASGIGDGLSTYFEARACRRSATKNFYGSLSSENSYAQARLCYEILLENSRKAYHAVKNKLCTPAVEKVIEASIYLSGVGNEGCGDAGAHGFHDAIRPLAETRDKYHGELVAFGLLTQLVLENESEELLDEIFSLCADIGLPVTLKELGIINTSTEHLMPVAEAASEGSFTNMPFPVSAIDVYHAMLAADDMGKRYCQ